MRGWTTEYKEELVMEMAVETVVRLLGSKNKAEVLEAIAFFQSAHGYGLAGAQVRVSRICQSSS